MFKLIENKKNNDIIDILLSNRYNTIYFKELKKYLIRCMILAVLNIIYIISLILNFNEIILNKCYYTITAIICIITSILIIENFTKVIRIESNIICNKKLKKLKFNYTLLNIANIAFILVLIISTITDMMKDII